MITAKVNGTWLSSLSRYGHGPFTVEYGLHGLSSVTWEMEEGLRHPLLTGNANVDVFDGGYRIGTCRLVDPSTTGKFMARGLYHQAFNNYALGQLQDITAIPYDAVQWAINRFDINWSAVDPSVPFAAPWGSPTQPMTIADLLDGSAGELSMRWFVDVDKVCYMAADPVVPQWVVPHAVAGRGLTPAEDEFFTHATGRYRDSGGVYRTTTVGDADAAAVFGRKVDIIDLTDLGNTTQARANQVLSGYLARAGARMGWGETLDLGYGQITTPGGRPAPLNQIRSRQMIRLAGTVDTSRAYVVRTYTDIVADTVKYVDGSQRISITPVGYAPRNRDDLLKLAISGDRR